MEEKLPSMENNEESIDEKKSLIQLEGRLREQDPDVGTNQVEKKGTTTQRIIEAHGKTSNYSSF